MLFGVKNELQTYIVFNNVTIKNSTDKKVLKITIDSNVGFSIPLTSIAKKVNIMFNTLTRVQKHMTPVQKTIKILFYL